MNINRPAAGLGNGGREGGGGRLQVPAAPAVRGRAVRGERCPPAPGFKR